jgi:signal transduction histidine kinase/AmiR/NasT family two-component response regulator
MNEELQTQQKELSEANVRLAEASRAKSDFLANMSHELRTPLNSILGFSEILHDEMYGPLSGVQKEYVSHINGSGKHLLGLINDILDLSKVESGRMELNPTRFSLSEVLSGALVMVREKAMKHGIGLRLDVEPAADREVECDERKLKQVLFNLLSNAVKFTPDGGSVSVRARKVQSSEFKVQRVGNIDTELRTMNSELDRDLIEISVVDTGIGIKPGDMGKLFQEFTQLESPYSKGYEGTGLGLALTKRLVELLGGSIRAESAWEKGSTFTFILPVKHAEEPPLPAAAGRKKTAAPSDRKRALIIDDDPLTLQLVVTALTTEGYEVLTASNGEDGIEAARREPPGLIVLDLMMPGMSGFEVADALSSDERMADIPVVVLTAMSISSEDRKRLEKGVDRIIEKGGLSRSGFIAEVKKAARDAGENALGGEIAAPPPAGTG